MAIKKKYTQAPKEKKYFMIGLPFFLVGMLFMIPITIGVGLIPCLILFLLCDGIFLVFIILGIKEHKKWIAEGNPPYRYYDTETGQEVDENGNPITGQSAPQPKPQPAPAPQSSGEDQPEPEPVFEGEHQEAQPAPQPAPQKEPETIRGADLTIFGKLLPAAGLGLLALAFLLRTIMFIRELVDFAKYGSSWESYIEYAIRILGPLVLLALCVVALVKFFVNKQTINQGYKAMLKIAIWYAVLNIVGLVYILTCAGLFTYDMISLMIRDSGNANIYVEMLIKGIIIDLLYIAFAIVLIIFTKIALKNNADSVKNKVFMMLPFGIIVLTEVLFMIITGATLPEGYVAPGYFVTAVIVLLGAASLGAIPFLVRFEKKDADGAAVVAPAAAPVYQEPKEPQDLDEPKEVKPNKKNDGDPEVKSNKKGLIIILIIVLALVLVGGGVTAGILISKKNRANGEIPPKDDDTGYVAPSRSSSSSSSKSSSSSSSSSSKSSSSSSSSVVSKTPKEVMADIAANIYGVAKYYDDNNSDYNYWYDSSNGFVSIVSFEGTFDESYLDQAVSYVVDKLPSYLRSIDEIHSVTWGDGTNGSAQDFVSQDGQVKVELGSYIEEGTLSCQVISHFNF